MKKIWTREEKNALKRRHRIEMVMQEAGERFEVDKTDPQTWRAVTRPGLTVNTRTQTFTLSRPGMEFKSGDVITWVMFAFRLSFPQGMSYLQSRKADPIQEAPPLKSDDAKKTAPPKPSRHYIENETYRTDLEETGLYDRGAGYRDGRSYYYYILKPVDRLQEEALEVGGEGMREFFTWKVHELEAFMGDLPKRFKPVEDAEVLYCDECEEPISRSVPQTHYAPRASARRLQPVVYEYALWGEHFSVCASCKQKMLNRSRALELIHRSAYKRQKIEWERERQEAWAQELQEEREREREEERANVLLELEQDRQGDGAAPGV